jgi:cytochrome c2
MKSILHTLKAGIVTVGLLTVVIYGGRLISTGSLSEAEETFTPVVAIKEAPKATAGNAPAEVDAPFVATAKAGKRVAGKCKACHSFKEGDTKKKTGPNLWGIMGRDIAAIESFKYSPAMEAKKGEIVWDEESITAYLTKPKEYIPGNKMAFAGLRKEEDRQNIIAYLDSLK